MPVRSCVIVGLFLLWFTAATKADVWDNPNVAAPIVNNGITLDGSFSDWGTAGSNYSAFGPWNEWWSNNGYSGIPNTPKDGAVTTSRVAIDTADNRLIIGVQTTEANPYFELNGLFGGTNTSIAGERTSRAAGQSGDGAQLFFQLPTGPTSGPTAITFGGNEAWHAGVNLGAGTANPSGVTGEYQSDGRTYTAELSVPLKLDWTSADSSLANTYHLQDLAGLVGGSGLHNLNVAYNISDFYASTGFNGGDAQGARFDTGTANGTPGSGANAYGASTLTADYWSFRAVNPTGLGFTSTGGGLTLLGTPLPAASAVPEPGTFALLGLGALGVLAFASRRR